MARRSDHSREEIRDMALAACRRILSEEGFRALTARRVAKEIGYTVGTLYLIFRNFDDMILAVNGQTLEDLYHRLEQATAPDDLPAERRVRALCHAYLDFAVSQRARWTLIFEYELPAGATIPDWYGKKIMRNFALVEHVLSPLVEDEKHKVSEITRALWGGVHGICILALTGNLDVTGVNDVRPLLDILIDNFLCGLRSKE